MKCVKLIGNKKFEIEMLCNETTGHYVIRYESYGDNTHFESEPIADYLFASYMFDLKFMDLEGN